MRVGIVNVTGYAGAEIARLLARHAAVEIAWVTGRSEAGKRLASVFPHLREIDQVMAAEPGDAVDVAFLALPHHAAAEIAPGLLERGTRIVDISADFRLRDVSVYEEFYGKHPAPELIADAVYGLPEVYRSQIRAANLVANPGCYPTASILALLPALRGGMIHPAVIVDAKSGVSGAGRSLSLTSHFSEVDESVRAYGLDGHRHWPEIRQELQAAVGSGGQVRLSFTPHLIPMTRGILATCYADLAVDWPVERIRAAYQDFYAGEPFVRVVPEPPQTKQVLGQQLLLPVPDRRQARRAPRRGVRHRQSGQGRGRPGDPEHESDVRAARDHGDRRAAFVPVARPSARAAQFAAGGIMPGKPVSRSTIHAVTRGDAGSHLVLIHGAGGNRLIWGRQVAALSSAHRVTALDLPGHGRSGPPGRQTIGEYASDCGRLLDRLTSGGAGRAFHGWRRRPDCGPGAPGSGARACPRQHRRQAAGVAGGS